MANWFLWVLAAALFVSVVLLVLVCVHCRTKGPPVSIRQASEDYMPSTQFHVIHPSQPSTDLNSLHLPSNLLSPYLASAGRQQSFTATETESNPSYENPADGPDYINAESDAEDPGYIIVLPGGETPLTNQSRASTPSSDVLHDYENVPEKKVEPSSACGALRVSDEDRDYLNVEPLHFHTGSTPELSTCSDTDDDDEANYVNIHSDAQTG